MCGIGGVLGSVEGAVLDALLAAIDHRGPDDRGQYVDEHRRAALLHTRLSIIDPSPAGHQPMSSQGGRYWITFNGEVYNFAELRSELAATGVRFTSHTDTEVVLAAYAAWGRACVERLRGMFAFAIWDCHDGTLFLARDRMGIKPLYYAPLQGGSLVFASELRAVLAHPAVARRVDRQSLWHYLSLGSVPQPRTLIAGVQSLPPGHTMTIEAGVIGRPRRYWDVAEAAEQARASLPPTLDDARAELRLRLDEATRLNLVADVPVGAFLSGGIDSSAIVALMSGYVHTPIKTFSIAPESTHPELNELKWARLVANRLGTDHTEVTVSGEMVRNEWDALIEAVDQPSLDGTNTYFVSRAARQAVKVALSGLGGDELFGGYPHFRRFLDARSGSRRGPGLLRGAIDHVRSGILPSLSPSNGADRRSPQSAAALERHSSVRRLADERAKARMTTRELQAGGGTEPLSSHYARLLRSAHDAVAELSYVELDGYLANTLLRDADAMSMAHALELRPVLLDHPLAAYALALPAAWKVTPTATKAIFVDAVADLLPPEILTRPKMGFTLPLTAWLSGPLRERAHAAFASRHASAIFAPPFLKRANAAVAGEAQVVEAHFAYVVLLDWLARYRCEL